MPRVISTAVECQARNCAEITRTLYKTVLPNGTQLEVPLCNFHTLELEEIDFLTYTKEHASVQ